MNQPNIRRIPPPNDNILDEHVLRVTRADPRTYERLQREVDDVAAFIKGERRRPFVAVQ